MAVYNADKMAVLHRMMMEKAQSEKQAMLDEIEKSRTEKLEAVKDRALQDAYDLIQEQSGDINVQAVSSLSQKEMELRHRLVSKRDELAERVFQDAREQLKAFAAGDAYIPYLKNMLGKAAASGLFGDVKEETLLRVSLRDMEHQSVIREAFGLPCRIAADDAIRLGGFIAENTGKGLALDETLDRRLEEQKQWFSRHSGFTVDMTV